MRNGLSSALDNRRGSRHEQDKLEVEFAGDLAGILALTSGRKKPVTDGDGLQVTLVAGARIGRDRHSLQVMI